MPLSLCFFIATSGRRSVLCSVPPDALTIAYYVVGLEEKQGWLSPYLSFFSGVVRGGTGRAHQSLGVARMYYVVYSSTRKHVFRSKISHYHRALLFRGGGGVSCNFSLLSSLHLINYFIGSIDLFCRH